MGATSLRWPAVVPVLGLLAAAIGSAPAVAGGPDDPWFRDLVATTASRCEPPAPLRRRPRGQPTALDWLSAHQRPDGGFARDGDLEGPADLPATGLALLAFLSHGETHKHGDYRTAVTRGLGYLKRVQGPGGRFGPAEAAAFPFAHAIATTAMVQAYAMTCSPLCRGSAREALDFITRRTDAPPPWEAGARPGPGEAVAAAWLTRAVIEAARCGLDLPPWTIDRLCGWLARLGEVPTVLEAARLLALLRTDRLRPACVDREGAGARLLSRLDPPGASGQELCHSWEFLLLYGGDPRREFQITFHRRLEARQRRAPATLTGSFDPVSPEDGGRVAATALATLALAIRYEHLTTIATR